MIRACGRVRELTDFFLNLLTSYAKVLAHNCFMIVTVSYIPPLLVLRQMDIISMRIVISMRNSLQEHRCKFLATALKLTLGVHVRGLREFSCVTVSYCLITILAT